MNKKRLSVRMLLVLILLNNLKDYGVVHTPFWKGKLSKQNIKYFSSTWHIICNRIILPPTSALLSDHQINYNNLVYLGQFSILLLLYAVQGIAERV